MYINDMFGPIGGTRGRGWGVGEICMLGGGGGGGAGEEDNGSHT